MKQITINCITGEKIIEEIPDIPVDVEFLRQEKLKEIDVANQEYIQKGFYSSALGVSHFYRFNKEEDQLNFNQQISILILNHAIDTVYWKTEDAGVLLHNRNQFIQVINDATAHKQNSISYYWQLKSQVLNATTKEELSSIEYGGDR